MMMILRIATWIVLAATVLMTLWGFVDMLRGRNRDSAEW